MQHEHKYDQFRERVGPAIKSKLDEFEMLGYDKVTEEELWDYLVYKKWKRPKEEVRLYEIVADILSVQPGEYINFVRLEAFKLGSFVLDDEEERKELLK